MQFIVKAYDGAGMLEKRMEVRPDHLAAMEKLGRHVVCAGGLTDGDGNLKGSVLILDFADRAELDEYLAREPYIRAKVWETVEIEAINVVIVDGKRV